MTAQQNYDLKVVFQEKDRHSLTYLGQKYCVVNIIIIIRIKSFDVLVGFMWQIVGVDFGFSCMLKKGERGLRIRLGVLKWDYIQFSVHLLI